MVALNDSGFFLILQVWEDDANACVIKTDAEWLEAAWQAAGLGVSGGGLINVIKSDESLFDLCFDDIGEFAFCLVFLHNLLTNPFDIVEALNNDEYVGQLVPTNFAGECYNGNYFVIGEWGNSRGCVWISGLQMMPPEAAPPMTVAISGPTSISQKAPYTWTANPSGGGGSVTYQWSVHYFSTGLTYSLGTGQTQQLMVYAGDGLFQLTVTVTNGIASANDIHIVQECISPCEPL